MAIEPVNHFMVWPRLIACLLVAAIIYEIWLDRRALTQSIVLSVVLISLVAADVFGLSDHTYQDEGKVVISTLVVIIALSLAYGYYSQIMNIILTGEIGALDKKMSFYILLMDFSSVAFALSLGVKNGWPLLFLATISGVTKIIVLYLCRWVRVSEKALQLRQTSTLTTR
ncbi:hypothetical protein [Alteromonas sp. ASW11-130]|uniref:hypothetical protein n=1 Tax=Alteromonas sp. ASW11-130 TaxID=3015775 RepID=UPI0022419774|nr:hypothetical protein [Alteromonas sp. ASW11-130]MCW8090194.1 hypothetical protein [Alteromonas sp. ASW11-130]